MYYYLLLNFKSKILKLHNFQNEVWYVFFSIKSNEQKNSLSVYVFVDLRIIFPFNVILMRIIHIEIDKKVLL